MKKSKIKDISIFIVFILLIIMPVVKINFTPGKISETEKRYLADFPKLLNEEGKFVFEDFKAGFESWLNDNIGFRDHFVDLYGNIHLKVMNTSPNSQVEKGKEGWYYYTQNNNMGIANGDYPLSKNNIKKICEYQQRISDYYNKRGVEYVLILQPSKVSIYPEYIASGKYSYKKTPVDMIAEYLKENTTVKVIELKDELIKAKDEGLLYFKTDTHWNYKGAYVAYKTIIDNMNKFGIFDDKPEAVNFVDSSFKGEFSAMMGSVKLLDDEKIQHTEIIKKDAYRVESGELFDCINQIKSEKEIYTPLYMYNNDNADNKKMLFYGDSMFGSWNATELLAEHCAEFTFVWSYNMIPEYVEKLKPDVVVYEMTERYLNALGNNNYDFLCDDNSAKIEASDISGDFDNGFEVTVTNTGTESWSKKKNYKLCVLKNGNDIGYRVNIKGKEIVDKGEKYTFVIKKLAKFKDASDIEFQMVEDDVIFFGDRIKYNDVK